ncbi:L-threonylcarbamoyladenylate synthase, partial [Candidatus Hakubella thermalkaliphila]
PAKKPTPLYTGTNSILNRIPDEINETPSVLINKFCPGPLTMRLKAKKDRSKYLTASTGRFAVRIPGESFALHLAKKAGFPITSTSANISGMPPAEDAETVIKYFGEKIDMIIDRGRTPGGLPSTIVDAAGESIKIVREGAIPRSILEKMRS